MAKKTNTVLNNLPTEEILWADTKRWLGLPWTFTKYSVDKDRLYLKQGFWKTQTDELLLYRILDIKSSRTLWQRICGVGTVVLYCSDKSNGILEMKNIKKHDQVRRFLSELVEDKRTETGVKGREIYGMGGSVDHMDADGDGECDAAEVE